MHVTQYLLERRVPDERYRQVLARFECIPELPGSLDLVAMQID
jgi:hypothetical protein